MTGLLLAASETPGHQFASFDVPTWVWVAFVAFISILLLIDVLLVHRKPHVISFREAAIESSVWIAIGLAFTIVILAWQGGSSCWRVPGGLPDREEPVG